MIPDDDPEARCQDCGGPNPVWSADNDLWNGVMGSENGILCPRCFIEFAASERKAPNVWRLTSAERVRELEAERAAPLAIAAGIDAELQDLQSFVLVETGHMPTVNAVASLRSHVAKALGHSDPYCVAHCKPGVKHSQCGCRCGQHRRVTSYRDRS